MSAYATIDDLRSQLGSPASAPEASAAYAAKMLHKIPDATVIEREKFILEECKGRRVLEFGASGQLHAAISKVAAYLYATDKRGESPSVNETVDLDDVTLPFVTIEGAHNIRPDIVVCGEVIEHLANPGWFLWRLARQYPEVPIIITVPNAFSAVAQKHLARGIENVNLDHVAWYSPRTLMTLLERYGFKIDAFHWYRGDPLTAEGIVMVARHQLEVKA